MLVGKGLAKHAEDCGIVCRKENAREISLFPFKEPFIVRNEAWTASQVIEALKPVMSQARLDKIETVASARQFDVVPVIEGVYDKGNVAAVLRSADGVLLSGIVCCIDGHQVLSMSRHYHTCVLSRWTVIRVSCAALGYGQLHVVSNETRYRRSSRTSRGSDKWLDVLLWKDTVQCIQELHAQGRKVYVTDLSADAMHVSVRCSAPLCGAQA